MFRGKTKLQLRQPITLPARPADTIAPCYSHLHHTLTASSPNFPRCCSPSTAPNETAVCPTSCTPAAVWSTPATAWTVAQVSNQSTGYCPGLDSWQASPQPWTCPASGTATGSCQTPTSRVRYLDEHVGHLQRVSELSVLKAAPPDGGGRERPPGAGGPAPRGTPPTRQHSFRSRATTERNSPAARRQAEASHLNLNRPPSAAARARTPGRRPRSP